jgi:hypothetical protein
VTRSSAGSAPVLAEESPDSTLKEVRAEFPDLRIEIPPGCVSLSLAYQRWSLAPSFSGETPLILRDKLRTYLNRAL